MFIGDTLVELVRAAVGDDTGGNVNGDGGKVRCNGDNTSVQAFVDVDVDVVDPSEDA